jgi:hypothetical protein
MWMILDSNCKLMLDCEAEHLCTLNSVQRTEKVEYQALQPTTARFRDDGDITQLLQCRISVKATRKKTMRVNVTKDDSQ